MNAALPWSVPVPQTPEREPPHGGSERGGITGLGAREPSAARAGPPRPRHSKMRPPDQSLATCIQYCDAAMCVTRGNRAVAASPATAEANAEYQDLRVPVVLSSSSWVGWKRWLSAHEQEEWLSARSVSATTSGSSTGSITSVLMKDASPAAPTLLSPRGNNYQNTPICRPHRRAHGPARRLHARVRESRGARHGSSARQRFPPIHPAARASPDITILRYYRGYTPTQFESAVPAYALVRIIIHLAPPCLLPRSTSPQRRVRANRRVPRSLAVK